MVGTGVGGSLRFPKSFQLSTLCSLVFPEVPSRKSHTMHLHQPGPVDQRLARRASKESAKWRANISGPYVATFHSASFSTVLRHSTTCA